MKMKFLLKKMGTYCHGAKVTKGYFGDTDKEKFFSRYDKVWFKTGDIVEKKINGLFVLVKRFQVKISGYRIDLMK